MLSGITITCFAASYLIGLGLEVTRLFFRLPVRLAVIVGFTIAGLFAHTVYLWSRARAELLPTGSGTPLSSWYDWSLLLAWLLAAVYLVRVLRRPEDSTGLFLLPPVLALIGLAVLFDDVASFPRHEALSYWRIIHGSALLIGTVFVTLGFAAGAIYLFQSFRLKHKLPPRPGFRLPSLEWLQNCNRQALFISTCLLAIGLLSGIVLNLINHARQGYVVPWTDPVVWSSGVLFLWLMAAMLFEYFYKPARQGRKVAYLTLASVVFLGFALGSVLLGEHAGAEQPEEAVLREARRPGAAAGGDGPLEEVQDEAADHRL